MLARAPAILLLVIGFRGVRLVRLIGLGGGGRRLLRCRGCRDRPHRGGRLCSGRSR